MLAKYRKFGVIRLAKASLTLIPRLYPRKKAATIWELEKFSVLNSFPDLPFRPITESRTCRRKINEWKLKKPTCV